MTGSRLAILLGLLILVGAAGLAAVTMTRGGEHLETTTFQTAFTPASGSLPMSSNLLANAGFDHGQWDRADSWDAIGAGYAIDDTGGRNGSRALKLANLPAPGNRGASQVIRLAQDRPKPIHFSGWSRAENVSGGVDSDYSVYLDVVYDDGTPLYAQTLNFDTGVHDWQYREGFIVPARPVRSVSVGILLRGSHAGAAWFDDLAVEEVGAEIALFDGMPVTIGQTGASPPEGRTLSLATGDGLTLSLAPDGTVASTDLSGSNISGPRRPGASGFLVRDAAAQSAFVQVGGKLTEEGGVVRHRSELKPMHLALDATYTATSDRIAVHAEIEDRSATDRALTLYFALPVQADGWSWGGDIRSSRQVAGGMELANFGEQSEIGATGFQSRYPWASLAGQPGGIAMAVPIDDPRVFRLVYNPATSQLYAAFDVGLSPSVTRYPGKASIDLVIYRFAPEWGFRAAAEGYYRRFPDAFARRIPADKEGAWVAFSDLAPIPHLSDFGIGFHETHEVSHIPTDRAAGIMSFRYLSEPWSHWLPIDDPQVNSKSYDQVVSYLRRQLQSGTAAGQRQAEATITSGCFDGEGRYIYEALVSPWCKGKGGCALFTLNPDPGIGATDTLTTKARLEWDDAARQTYRTAPELAGEYIDSFETRSSAMDYRWDHFASSDGILTFRRSDRRLGIPVVFALHRYARWVADDVHRMGKWMMANNARNHTPWGAEAFDFAGAEVNWLAEGRFAPESDAVMNYRRTMSYQRPYGLLMNTNFERLTPDLVERYFQVSLFYGIYPSMFSEDSANNAYWDRPALYERDRALFRRYIPLIKRISAAGWEPVTRARASDPRVYIERYGTWPSLYFTLRNTTDAPATATLTVEAGVLEIPGGPVSASALLSGRSLPMSPPGPVRTVSVALPPQGTEVLYLTATDGPN